MSRAALAAGIVAVAVGCSRGTPVSDSPPPVARVNGEPLPAIAVRRELPPGAAESALRAALDAAVDRALLLQEARARAITVSDPELALAVAALRAEYPGAAFDQLLATQGTTAAALEARLREQLAIERVVTAALATVDVTEGEVRSWYDTHRDELARGEEVHARQIVTRSREDADRARAEVARRPSSFADVARRTSIAPEASAGGDLGWFAKGSGMPEVFDLCFTLAKDALSPVVASPYGFHVFQVVGRRGSATPPFDAARAAIAARLRREKRASAQQEFVAQLRARAKIDVDEAALVAALRETP